MVKKEDPFKRLLDTTGITEEDLNKQMEKDEYRKKLEMVLEQIKLLNEMLEAEKSHKIQNKKEIRRLEKTIETAEEARDGYQKRLDE